MKFKVIKACVNQDTGQKLKPGQVVRNLSAFERGRHLAEANIVPVDETGVERVVKAPAETRKKPARRTRKKTNGTN